MPGLRVCVDCYDSRHPQEFLQDVTDPEALWKPAPDGVVFTPPALSVSAVYTSLLLTTDSGLIITTDSGLELAASQAPAVVLNWTVADFGAYTVGGYSVYRASDGSTTYTKIATFPNVEDILQDGNPPITETLTYTDSSAAVGNSYLYDVSAYSLGSEIVNSNVVSVSI